MLSTAMAKFSLKWVGRGVVSLSFSSQILMRMEIEAEGGIVDRSSCCLTHVRPSRLGQIYSWRQNKVNQAAVSTKNLLRISRVNVKANSASISIYKPVN